MKNFGFKVVSKNGEIGLIFNKKPVLWRRFLSELVKQRVILRVKDAKKLLEKGDVEIYQVFNLWKFSKKAKEILKKYKLYVDLTLLFAGRFSRDGELFCTFGHLHEKERGELYFCLKNSCYLLLSDFKNKLTRVVRLREGYGYLIHPRFAHRLVSFKKDALVLTVSPIDAGHNYEIIKGKGFPYHLFEKKGKLKIIWNKKFPKHKLEMKRAKRIKFNWKKLKSILFEPENFPRFY